MEKRIGLRTKAYLLIVPLVAIVVVVSGILASLESRAALTGVATRLMAYKAEQLRNYALSEWEVITELGLDDESVYRETVQQSLQSYATSLLRSETEQIIAVNGEGELVMNVGLGRPQSGAAADERSLQSFSPEPGWFEAKLFGNRRVGVAFDLDPFNWVVAITELETAFFSEVHAIERMHIAILVVSLLVVTTFISIFVGYVIRPVERLTATVQGVATSNDLSRRAAIEFSDEVGLLAHEFNDMITSLERNYEQLSETTRAEKEARQTAIKREEETLLLLGRASEYRDQETGEHLHRVGALCAMIARLLGESEEKQELIRRSSQLHDIGKIAIPDAILLKAGELTAEEYEDMQRHTTIGYNLLKDSESIYLVEGARIALTHHERWDGSGYPSQLSGEEIPLSGRIVGMVDVFDALTSERTYKEAWNAEYALQVISEQSGKHFDPTLVEIFETHFEMLREVIRR